MLSDEDDMVKAVRSETGHHDYDEVILATGSKAAHRWLADCTWTRFTGCGGIWVNG